MCVFIAWSTPVTVPATPSTTAHIMHETQAKNAGTQENNKGRRDNVNGVQTQMMQNCEPIEPTRRNHLEQRRHS
jgi:hypothetical protein